MSSPDNLTQLIARIQRAPSPFYQPRLAASGLAAGERGDAGAFSRLPLTRRDELIRDQLAHRPDGTRRFADAGHAVRTGVTGSGDSLLVLTWTAADLARERAAGRRVLGQLGIAPGMRVANTLPGSLVSPGSLLLGDVIEEIGGLDVPLGAIESDAVAKQAWELFDRVQPAVLVAERGQADRLFAAAPAAARPWWRGIVWLERGDNQSTSIAVPEAAGFSGWQRHWLAVAEATAFVAVSCASDRYHPDSHVLAEIVDPESGVPLPAGREGMLALTPFGVDTPVLRFASDVRARLATASCDCGLGGGALESLSSRRDGSD